MFDVGWSEMFIILLVAILVIGPRDLPKVARTVGRWMGKARAMAREFQRSLDDMMREAELDELKKQIEKVGSGDLGSAIDRTVDPGGEISKALDFSDVGRSESKEPQAAMEKRREASEGEAEAPDAELPQPEKS